MITELYERLHMDVTEFDEEDVITTSPLNPDLNEHIQPDDEPEPMVP